MLNFHEVPMTSDLKTADAVLIALRRIIRTVDIHSKKLVRSQGLTVPQILVLKEIDELGWPTVGEIARGVTLSQATVTNILSRLEQRGIVERSRSEDDKRRVLVRLTDEGARVLRNSPSLLHEDFLERFDRLQDWEQNQILASMQRLAQLMDAEQVDAAPMLITDPIMHDDLH